MFERGVTQTSVADVITASGTSKSQFYQHFTSKDSLVSDVIERRRAYVVEQQLPRLQTMDSMRGLELWAEGLVACHGLHQGAFGCPLGSLAAELSDTNEDARRQLASAFAEWEQLLARGLTQMRANGTLREDADPVLLATGLMAAVQGGYLLAQTARSIEPMKVSLEMAIAYVRTYAEV